MDDDDGSSAVWECVEETLECGSVADNLATVDRMLATPLEESLDSFFASASGAAFNDAHAPQTNYEWALQMMERVDRELLDEQQNHQQCKDLVPSRCFDLPSSLSMDSIDLRSINECARYNNVNSAPSPRPSKRRRKDGPQCTSLLTVLRAQPTNCSIPVESAPITSDGEFGDTDTDEDGGDDEDTIPTDTPALAQAAFVRAIMSHHIMTGNGGRRCDPLLLGAPCMPARVTLSSRVMGAEWTGIVNVGRPLDDTHDASMFDWGGRRHAVCESDVISGEWLLPGADPDLSFLKAGVGCVVPKTPVAAYVCKVAEDKAGGNPYLMDVREVERQFLVQHKPPASELLAFQVLFPSAHVTADQMIDLLASKSCKSGASGIDTLYDACATHSGLPLAQLTRKDVSPNGRLRFHVQASEALRVRRTLERHGFCIDDGCHDYRCLVLAPWTPLKLASVAASRTAAALNLDLPPAYDPNTRRLRLAGLARGRDPAVICENLAHPLKTFVSVALHLCEADGFGRKSMLDAQTFTEPAVPTRSQAEQLLDAFYWTKVVAPEDRLDAARYIVEFWDAHGVAVDLKAPHRRTGEYSSSWPGPRKSAPSVRRATRTSIFAQSAGPLVAPALPSRTTTSSLSRTPTMLSKPDISVTTKGKRGRKPRVRPIVPDSN